MNRSKEFLIENLRNRVGELFIKEGLTLEVIKLSQELDKYILEKQLDMEKNTSEYLFVANL